MTTRRRPDPYASATSPSEIVRIATGLLRQWEESRKPWPVMAAFAGAQRARALVDAADRQAQLRADAEGTAVAANRQTRARANAQGTRASVEHLEQQARAAMWAYAEQQMRTPSLALEAQPERTAVDIREALRRDYAKTRLQQAAWLKDSTRPRPQSHVPNAVHKRIARELGVSVSAVNSARVAWLGEHRPPPGETVETWRPIERDAEERAAEERGSGARPERDAKRWADSRRAVRETAERAADMRIVREVERRGREIDAAGAAAAQAPQAVTAPKPEAGFPKIDFSRKAGRK